MSVPKNRTRANRLENFLARQAQDETPLTVFCASQSEIPHVRIFVWRQVKHDFFLMADQVWKTESRSVWVCDVITEAASSHRGSQSWQLDLDRHSFSCERCIYLLLYQTWAIRDTLFSTPRRHGRDERRASSGRVINSCCPRGAQKKNFSAWERLLARIVDMKETRACPFVAKTLSVWT